MSLQANHYTQIKHDLQIFTDASKALWGVHLNERTARGTWSLSGKQVAYQLPRTQGSLSSLKRVPRPHKTRDSICRDRQHQSGVIHTQGRRHEVGPTLSFTMENLTRYSQTLKARQILGWLSVVADKLSRLGQTTQREWSLLQEVFLCNMQQVAPVSNRLICHLVQQQVALVCVTSTESPGHSSGCSQSAMVGSGSIHLPTISHIGQSSEVAGLSMQENHSDCSGVTQHALVLGSSGHVQSNPTEPAHFSQPVDTTIQSDP